MRKAGNRVEGNIRLAGNSVIAKGALGIMLTVEFIDRQLDQG
jgi:hypothetical protein